MNDDLDRDQRALLWDLRHPDIARENLADATDSFPTHRARIDRNEWKWRELAHLILHHGYTSIPILAVAWNLSRTRTRSCVRTLINRSAVQEVTLPASGQRLVMLTSAGLVDARSALDRDISCNTQPARIGRTLVGHTLACQRAAINVRDESGDIGLHEYEKYEVDKMMTVGMHKEAPDIVMGDEDDAIMIEVELARKNPKRLREKMNALACAIWSIREPTNACIWYCANNQIRDALTRARERLDEEYGEAGSAIDIAIPDWLNASGGVC